MLTLIRQVAGKPWAIHADFAGHVRGLVEREGIAGLRHLAALKADAHAFDAAAGRTKATGQQVAVIPIVGTLTQRVEAIGSMDATRSTAAVASEVRAAVADPQVDAVVLEVDSPGGEVFGVPEAWRELRAAAGRKPIVAAVNSIAASAAYWLSSAASEIWVTPSGMAGSIGVYALHVDLSKQLEAEGEKWTFISAGKYKLEGNPAEPLGEEAVSALQGQVNDFYGMFVHDVARGRKVGVDVVRNGFGEGRMLLAQAAVEQGMADRVGTLEEAVRRASQLGRDASRERQARAQGVAAATLRAREL